MRRTLLLGGMSSVLGAPFLQRRAAAQERALLNVSYDPTREFYRDVNAAFAAEWSERTRQQVRVRMSHGGSGRQARAVIDGLEADVVTLGLGWDVEVIAQAGLLRRDWIDALPERAAPYRSTVAFVVRKGNPKAIRDWSDLARPGVQAVASNPKTSAGGRWSYFGAWGWARSQPGGSEAAARDFLRTVYRSAPVLDVAARGSTTSFARRGIGDVLLNWENESFLVLQEFGAADFEIVVPSRSILAEPPVAVVDANARRRGTADVARAYLEFLYTPKVQAMAAKHHYRPVYPQHADPSDLRKFPQISTFTIEEAAGGWARATADHIADGGIFDQIMGTAR
jgi:sulfate/thiosulfate transport system substrate-binding protein